MCVERYFLLLFLPIFAIITQLTASPCPISGTMTQLTLGADLDRLPPSSRRRSDFFVNFMQFLFIEKSKKKSKTNVNIHPYTHPQIYLSV